MMMPGTNARASDRPGEPDPAAFERFCHTIVPGCLTEVCHVDAKRAGRVGEDILARGESYAALDESTRDVLIAPFIEEVVDYEPPDAPLPLKGAVAVVVRNSLLEDAHALGPVEAGGITGITSMAAAPLSHLLAVRRRKPVRMKFNIFADLADTYPRAWACLGAVALAYQAGGGRFPYRAPLAPVPELPVAEVEAPNGDGLENAHVYSFVLSGIDTRFATQEIELLSKLVEPGDDDGSLCLTPSLSRLARNIGKLMRIIEYLLAHDVPILTANYLMRSSDVWVRRGGLAPADRENMLAAWRDARGLSGAHRATAAKAAKQLEAEESTTEA
jgi:hypothetical protein